MSAPRTQPPFVEPQLATLVGDVPTAPGWVYEIKYDGYRTLVSADGADVRCYSRNGLDWTGRFGSVPRAIAALKLRSALLDGETVFMDSDGRTSFSGLHDALTRGGAGIRFVAFDLLHLDGVDLRPLPLLERKERLAKILAKPDPSIIYSAHIVERGADLFASLCRRHYEGIIAKRGDRPYRSGRGSDWVKVKCLQEQEFVVAGYTKSDVVARPFSSLILALNEPGGLRYAGHVGTGFTHEELRRLKAMMKPLERATSAVIGKVPSDLRRRAVWLESRLVVQVAFTEFTSDGMARHSSYRGVREDRPADAVHQERPAAASPARRPRR